VAYQKISSTKSRVLKIDTNLFGSALLIHV
jgi:hypothetical protein